MADKLILIGRQEIMDYIDIKTPQLLQDLLKRGLPARSINKRLYAHRENIDAWFKKYTNVRLKATEGDSHG